MSIFTLDQHIEELQAVLTDLGQLSGILDNFSEALTTAMNSGKKLITAGNGGSAAEAAHFAEEFTGRFYRERKSLPGICLAIDGTLLTCIGNDYGYDYIFSRQIEGLGNPGDVFVVFSSSGNSENLILALKAAKEKGLITAAFLGKGGGKTKGLADYDIIIPSNTTMRVQELHLFLLHIVCDRVERAILGIGDQ